MPFTAGTLLDRHLTPYTPPAALFPRAFLIRMEPVSGSSGRQHSFLKQARREGRDNWSHLSLSAPLSITVSGGRSGNRNILFLWFPFSALTADSVLLVSRPQREGPTACPRWTRRNLRDPLLLAVVFPTHNFFSARDWPCPASRLSGSKPFRSPHRVCSRPPLPCPSTWPLRPSTSLVRRCERLLSGARTDSASYSATKVGVLFSVSFLPRPSSRVPRGSSFAPLFPCLGPCHSSGPPYFPRRSWKWNLRGGLGTGGGLFFRGRIYLPPPPVPWARALSVKLRARNRGRYPASGAQITSSFAQERVPQRQRICSDDSGVGSSFLSFRRDPYEAAVRSSWRLLLLNRKVSFWPPNLPFTSVRCAIWFFPQKQKVRSSPSEVPLSSATQDF